MAAVGARMEAVAPRRSLFGPDYLLLAALAAVSLGIHLWLVAHTKVTARDSLGFARYALDLQSPESSDPTHPLDPTRQKLDVIREAQQPPGYPLAIWVTAKFVRKTMVPPLPGGLFTGLQLAESTLLAAQIANALAALFLVVPTYLIGRMLFGRSIAFSASFLFQVLPVPARITSDGLSEGVYLLAVATSMMFAVRAVRRPGVGGFLVTGLCVGASYLVRPEAMLVAAATGLVAAWLGYTRSWPRDLTLGRLTALAVGVALVAGPYMLLIGKFSNKPTANQMTDPTDNPRAKLWKGQTDARPQAVAGGPVFAKWMTTPVHGTPSRAIWGTVAVAEETFKTMCYVPALFAVVGIFLLRRRIAVEPGLWMLLVLGAMNAALLVYLGTRIGYVSERHTVLLSMIGCLFAATAFEPLAAALGTLPKMGLFWSGKFGPPALLVILVGLALPATLKPMHSNREGFKHAGEWLGEHCHTGACVIDPFAWTEWYAGRSLYYIPPDPPPHSPPLVTYAIVDDKMHGGEHERLPRLDAAKNVIADGRKEVVYHWPEDVPLDQAKVKVYMLIRITTPAVASAHGGALRMLESASSR
jgi:hypothetical protein